MVSGQDDYGPILQGFQSPISGMFLYGGLTLSIEAADADGRIQTNPTVDRPRLTSCPSTRLYGLSRIMLLTVFARQQ